MVPLVEATEHLLATLEHRREANLPIPPETVRLAALFITIQAKLAVQGGEPTWENARPLIELAFARDRVEALTSMRENREFSRSKPEILTPEPGDEPPDLMLFDLVRTFREVLENARPPLRNLGGTPRRFSPVALNVVPVAKSVV